MKNRILILLATFAVILFCALSAQSQTNTATTNTTSGLNIGDIFSALKPLIQATNYAFEPYATYAPKAPSGQKVGGGLLAIYNVNQFVGLGVGADYLGQFTLVSANVELKLPVKPFASLTPEGTFLHDITATPFALAGIGNPFSGSSTGPVSIADVGAALQFGHLWGGRFNIGGAYGRWENAGVYSGDRYHFFGGISFGF